MLRAGYEWQTMQLYDSCSGKHTFFALAICGEHLFSISKLPNSKCDLPNTFEKHHYKQHFFHCLNTLSVRCEGISKRVSPWQIYPAINLVINSKTWYSGTTSPCSIVLCICKLSMIIFSELQFSHWILMMTSFPPPKVCNSYVQTEPNHS